MTHGGSLSTGSCSAACPQLSPPNQPGELLDPISWVRGALSQTHLVILRQSASGLRSLIWPGFSSIQGPQAQATALEGLTHVASALFSGQETENVTNGVCRLLGQKGSRGLCPTPGAPARRRRCPRGRGRAGSSGAGRCWLTFSSWGLLGCWWHVSPRLWKDVLPDGGVCGWAGALAEPDWAGLTQLTSAPCCRWARMVALLRLRAECEVGSASLSPNPTLGDWGDCAVGFRSTSAAAT